MNQFVILEFFNSNKKRPVYIRSGAIAGYDHDATHGTNVIYSQGGVFPVQETLEEIRLKIESLNLNHIKEPSNVSKPTV